MKDSCLKILSLVLTVVILSSLCLAEGVSFVKEEQEGKQVFRLSNDRIHCSVVFSEGKLEQDSLEGLGGWPQAKKGRRFELLTDADFLLDVMWTGWRAPGKENNAENPVSFSKEDFRLESHEIHELPGGVKALDLFLKHIASRYVRIELRLTYSLEPDAFYARRKVSVRDTSSGIHFLQRVWPLKTSVSGRIEALKKGGFGQPIAVRLNQGGAFFGLEYPASENVFTPIDKTNASVQCGQEIGERIGNSWVESEWVVTGITPDLNLKQWFFKYLDRLRVAPLRPYLLYNSWYDLRAPEYVDTPERAMTEANVLKTVESFRKRLYEKHGLSLDSFVLDDGWDVYKSDWVLSSEQFPRGLAPLVKALKTMGTGLGVWFGPIGGYSHRDWRVDWMKEHGYEVVGNQLCLGGEKYRTLFKKRVVDFAQKEGVRYYKWDGIQFSCSEPDHGHLPGIFSRRHILETVIDLCRSVRAINDQMFLNITSGTWLSPWWLKYANTIWMQGGDYGYADVPSISRRDSAITYRDSLLYDGLRQQDCWFPIANLMTHGIIKGLLQMLGGEKEPRDKFTDNALLYVARGPSMWELYISPDILTEEEWDAMAGAIRWAKDRFKILSFTEMVGGDPDKREAYGYAHFSGKQGILACRNPFIEPQTLRVELTPSIGLDPEESSLVVERVYPTRTALPSLFRTGTTLDIPLQGYETAVYEIYPLEDAPGALLTGVRYEILKSEKGIERVILFDGQRGARLLNPEKFKSVSFRGKTYDPKKMTLPVNLLPEPLEDVSLSAFQETKKSRIEVRFNLGPQVEDAHLALLLEPEEKVRDAEDPVIEISIDGNMVEIEAEAQKGRWGWYLAGVTPGKHAAQVKIYLPENRKDWKGKASLWFICLVESQATEISFELATEAPAVRPQPPRPWPPGFTRKSIKLGEAEIKIGSNNS